MNARTVAGLFVLGLLVPGVTALAADNEPTVAARERQNAVKTLSVRFKRTEVIAPGGVSLVAGRLAPSKSPIPSVESKLESVNRFVLAERRMVRFEDNHPSWMVPNGKLLERSCISVTDGTDGLMLFPTGIGAEGVPKGIIENTVRIGEFRSPVLAPLALTFRALDSVMSDEDIEGWKPTGVQALIRGTMCEEYDNPGFRQSVRRFWVDPARRHVVRRIQISRNGKLSSCKVESAAEAGG